MSNRFEDLIKNPITMLILNACVTYGVITTQLQWIRSDLDKQSDQIKRIENHLFFEVRKKNSNQQQPVCLPSDVHKYLIG